MLRILRLEERIVLEAAAVDAFSAVGTTSDDTGDQSTDPFDSGADSTDGDDGHASDPGATDSGDSHDPSGPVRVLAISSAVQDPEVLAGAAMEGVLTYIYDDSHDLDAILADIADMLDGRKADSIAFASHSDIAGQFLLAGDHLVSGDTLATDAALADFWEGVGELVRDGGSLDIMACDAASGELGLATLDALRELTGVDVSGSDDATGGENSGGDWILEVGGVDLTERYFDADALADYDDVLASAWMVTDLNTLDWGTFQIYEAAYAGGRWLVSGWLDGVGRELFVYDTVNETFTLLKDINPGGSNSNPTNFCVYNNVLYFQANDGTHGRELWRSNGTEGGTVLVKDINPGANSSTPHSFCTAEGRLFFVANDGTHGYELWKTAGSETYTVLVEDINPGENSSDPEQLTEISGYYKPLGGTYLYFTANDGSHGRELWISVSGTTVMVEDIKPGAESSNPQNLTVTGGLPATRCLFYTADDGTHGRELWLTNSNGTRLVKDIVPGPDPGDIIDMCEYGGDLYLVVKCGMDYGQVLSDLWWHDGYGLKYLASLDSIYGYYVAYANLQDMGSYLGLSGGHQAGWYMDWRPIMLTYNGLTHTITPALDEGAGFKFIDGGNVDFLIDSMGFAYSSTGSGFEWMGYVPWSYSFVIMDNKLFFNENEILYSMDSAGTKTRLLVSRLDGINFSSNPVGMINVDGTLYFCADGSGVGMGLWKSDGTEAGTVFLKAMDINPETFTVMNGDLYFTGDGMLWTTDGTADGTVSIGSGYSSISGDLCLGDGELYFLATGSGGDRYLYRSDGTASGTTCVDMADAWPSWANEIDTLFFAGGYLYYTSRLEYAFHAIKRTDGTVEGTTTLVDKAWLSGDDFYFAKANELVLFPVLVVPDESGGIWQTDGTKSGTAHVPYLSTWIYDSVEYGGELYFQTLVDETAELWKTDGTEAGTVLVKVLGGSSMAEGSMRVVDGAIYFAGSTADQGVELWVSDGTGEGTRVIKDINPGSGDSSPWNFTSLDGVVYFTADDGVHGRELWRTDGTLSGTALVKDVLTGSESGLSANAYLAVLGEDLFFAASDGAHGTELWTYATLARDDEFSFYEDVGSFSGNLFDDNGNGADSDSGSSLTLMSANGAVAGEGSDLGYGTLLVQSNGDFTYTITDDGYDYLTGGDTETLTFAYEALVDGISCEAFVTFTILGRNSAPVVVDDTSSLTEGSSWNCGISVFLMNDFDPEGDDLTFVTVSSISDKGVVVSFTGSVVRYSAIGIAEFESLDPGQTATDFFTYTVRDELGATSTGTMTLTIHGVQEPPDVSGISDQSFTENVVNAGYQAIAASAEVTDEDSGNFDNGVLLIGYEGDSLAEDSLTVMNGTYDSYEDGGTGDMIRLSILLVGNELYHVRETQAQGSSDWVEDENVVFGTVIEDGQAGSNLFLHFNAQATPDIVQGLLRLVGYANDSDMPTEYRTVRYVIDDGDDYGFSQTVYQVIQVTAENDGPVTGTVTDATDEDTSLTFNVADLVAQASDPEGHDFSFGSLAATSANGVVLSLEDGVITYDPLTSATVQAMTQGATAQDTFTYTLVDSEGATGTGTVTIDLTGVNDVPVISGLSDWTADEDTAKAVYHSINTAAVTVFDAENRDFDGGVLSVGHAGQSLAEDSLYLGDAVYDQESVTRKRISVSGTNVFYSEEIYESGAWSSLGSLVIGNVTSWGYNGGTLKITFNSNAVTHMVDALLTAIRYRNSSDNPTEYRTLSYTLTDGDGGTSDAAEQVIRVTPVNDAPTGVDDTASTNKAEVLTLAGADLVANDTDPDLDTLAVVSVDGTSAEGATVTLNGDGDVVYDPGTSSAFQSLTHGMTATDTFSYTLSDGHGGTSTAEVTVTVHGTNEAPVAADDTYATNEDTSFTTGNVLANDTDGDAGDTLVVDSVDTTGTQGTVTDNGDGTFDYDPDGQFEYLAAGESATDTFSYTISDGHGGTDTATVTITVNGVNDDPTGGDDTASTNKADVLTLAGADLMANDTDAELDTLSIVSVDGTSAEGATVTLNGDGDVVYDPGTSSALQGLAHGESATDTFRYTLSDGHGGTSTAEVTVTVHGTNEAPVAADDTFSTNEETSFTTGNVLANDTDGDAGDTLVVDSVDTTGTRGSVTDNGDGTFDYDPDGQFEYLAAGESATDTFSYTISDGHGGTDTATVSITVNGVNDDPTSVDDGYSTDEDTSFTTGNVLANDTDPDTSDTLSVTSVDTTGTKGSVTDNGDGTFDYDPNGQFEYLNVGETATDTFGYTISDGHGGTDTATVTITISGVQEAPTAVDDSGYGVDADNVLNVAGPGVLGNDTGDNCSVSVGSYDTVSAHGASVSVNLATGAFSYDPTGLAVFQALAQGETLTDTFTYLILDQYGMWCTQEATVSILVTGVNDAPVAVADLAQTTSDRAVTGNLIDNDVDVDHGAVLELASISVDGTNYAFGPGDTEFVVQLGQGTLQVLANGDYRFDPGMGYESLASGKFTQEQFTYLVRDEHGAGSSAPATMTLLIQGTDGGSKPLFHPEGLHLGERSYQGRSFGPASGEAPAMGPGFDLPSHGRILAQGLHLMNRDKPWFPASRGELFSFRPFTEQGEQAAAAFDRAVDSMPGLSQLTRIALKHFNDDFSDLFPDHDGTTDLQSLQEMASYLEHMLRHMSPLELARLHDVVEFWLQSLRDRAGALDSQDLDMRTLLEHLEAIEQTLKGIRAALGNVA